MEQELVIRPDGTVTWYRGWEKHNSDGPAVEYTDGTREWWFAGLRHREDGPAIEYANGDCSWYLNGKHYSFSEWVEQANITPEQCTLLLLKWGSHA
jgi:hypothetical protein